MTLRYHWPAKLVCLGAAGVLYLGASKAPTARFVPAGLQAGHINLQARTVVQGVSTGDDTDVPPKQMEKYIAAYIAMQKDRSLTAEQAASRQGLTLKQFRAIEERVERNDQLRERVRDALSEAAKKRSQPAPGAGRPH